MSDSTGLAFNFSPLREPVPDAQASSEAARRFRVEGGAETQGQVTAGAVIKAIVLVLGA